MSTTCTVAERDDKALKEKWSKELEEKWAAEATTLLADRMLRTGNYTTVMLVLLAFLGLLTLISVGVDFTIPVISWSIFIFAFWGASQGAANVSPSNLNLLILLHAAILCVCCTA